MKREICCPKNENWSLAHYKFTKSILKLALHLFAPFSFLSVLTKLRDFMNKIQRTGGRKLNFAINASADIKISIHQFQSKLEMEIYQKCASNKTIGRMPKS